MTRDEAILKFNSAGSGSSLGDAWIDRFVALGILKLDEPKSAKDKFFEEMISRGYSQNNSVFGDMLCALGSANVKLVEK